MDPPSLPRPVIAFLTRSTHKRSSVSSSIPPLDGRAQESAQPILGRRSEVSESGAPLRQGKVARIEVPSSNSGRSQEESLSDFAQLCALLENALQEGDRGIKEVLDFVKYIESLDALRQVTPENYGKALFALLKTRLEHFLSSEGNLRRQHAKIISWILAVAPPAGPPYAQFDFSALQAFLNEVDLDQLTLAEEEQVVLFVIQKLRQSFSNPTLQPWEIHLLEHFFKRNSSGKSLGLLLPLLSTEKFEDFWDLYVPSFNVQLANLLRSSAPDKQEQIFCYATLAFFIAKVFTDQPLAPTVQTELYNYAAQAKSEGEQLLYLSISVQHASGDSFCILLSSYFPKLPTVWNDQFLGWLLQLPFAVIENHPGPYFYLMYLSLKLENKISPKNRALAEDKFIRYTQSPGCHPPELEQLNVLGDLVTCHELLFDKDATCRLPLVKLQTPLCPSFLYLMAARLQHKFMLMPEGLLALFSTQADCVKILKALAKLVSAKRLGNLPALENDLSFLLARGEALKPFTPEQREEIQKALAVLKNPTA